MSTHNDADGDFAMDDEQKDLYHSIHLRVPSSTTHYEISELAHVLIGEKPIHIQESVLKNNTAIKTALPVTRPPITDVSVRFANAGQCFEFCQKLRQKLHEHKLMPYRTTMTRHKQKSLNSQLKSRGHTDTIYVYNLPNGATESDLISVIKLSAEMTPKSVELVTLYKDDEFPTMAQVVFDRNQDADECVDHLCGAVFHGNHLWADWKFPLPKEVRDCDRNEALEGKTNCVMILNVHYSLWGAQKKGFDALVNEFGDVLSSNNIQKFFSHSKCVEVEMKTTEGAMKLFKGLHGKKVMGLTLETKYWKKVPKAKREHVKRERVKSKLKDLIKDDTIAKKVVVRARDLKDAKKKTVPLMEKLRQKKRGPKSA